MKKVFLFAMAAVAALAMFSCSKEIEAPVSGDPDCPEGYYVEELSAVYPSDAGTKTAFNETNGKFAWTEGDELAFHLSNDTYVSAAIDPATSKVKLFLPIGVTRDNYAVYPASAVVDDQASPEDMAVTLPDTYDISGDPRTDYVPMPLIAINDADNKHLHFEHVGALLQVNLTVPAGVKTAKVSMGKVITGLFELEDGTGNGIIAPGAASGEDGVTFVLSEDGLASATEVKLLTPLPSGSYDLFKVEYDNGFEFSKDLSANPWTFSRTQGKKVSISDESFEDPRDYFWIEALEAGSEVIFRDSSTAGSTDIPGGSVYYSYDKKNWFLFEFDNQSNEQVFPIEEGQRVYFYELKRFNRYIGFFAENFHVSTGNYIRGNGKLKIGGNILSLFSRNLSIPMEKEGGKIFCGAFEGNTALVDAGELVLPDYCCYDCFSRMFEDCTNLIVPPVIPSVPKVPDYAYFAMFRGCANLTSCPDLNFDEVGTCSCCSMFEGCSSIVSTPELKASILGNSCYSAMFRNCTSLVNAPELPVTKLAESCYSLMFRNCTSLVNAPELPATELAGGCYRQMFYGCTSLSVIPELLPATVMYKQCYKEMFKDCYSLVNAPELPATTLADGCYSEMFYFCRELVNGPSILPAEDIPYSACYFMFAECKKLQHAPIIKAKRVGGLGCNDMFYNCISITDSIDLPVEEFYGGSSTGQVKNLQSMFASSGISGIILHFKDCNLGYCCRYMFENCKNLKSITVAFEEWPTATAVLTSWVSGVTNNASCSFYKPANLTVKRGINNIPTKWTVYNLEEVGAGV